jgi:hypothetical protein
MERNPFVGAENSSPQDVGDYIGCLGGDQNEEMSGADGTVMPAPGEL